MTNPVSGRTSFTGPGSHRGQRERGRSLQGDEWSDQRRDLGGGYRTQWQRKALSARDIMTWHVRTLSRQSTLKEAAQIMRDENVGIVPVVDQSGRLLGVLTDRDMVVRVFAEDRLPSQVHVQDVMSDDVEAVTENDEVRDIIELMGRKQIRRVPVVDRNDRLVGIVSLGDIANRADYDEELQEALEKISAKRSFWSHI